VPAPVLATVGAAAGPAIPTRRTLVPSHTCRRSTAESYGKNSLPLNETPRRNHAASALAIGSASAIAAHVAPAATRASTGGSTLPTPHNSIVLSDWPGVCRNKLTTVDPAPNTVPPIRLITPPRRRRRPLVRRYSRLRISGSWPGMS